ncbi:MAG: hypothetical protein ACE5I7_20675, partial [Candidatus Binatia bacterium]
MREHGVPTWHDVANLNEEPTEEELRRLLRQPETSSAVLWLTPEVEQSLLIRQVEAPEIVRRARRKDGFFVVPVVAGGLDYADVSRILDAAHLFEDLTTWNLRRVSSDPIGYGEAAEVARCVLSRRLAKIHAYLDQEQPLHVGLYARAADIRARDEALRMDWTQHFDGRVATGDAWTSRLLPALGAVRAALGQIPDRKIIAGGRPSLSAALAFGRTFVQPAGFSLSWEQSGLGGDT